MPVYKPSFRRLERKKRTVKTWTEDSISSLQTSLEGTITVRVTGSGDVAGEYAEQKTPMREGLAR